MGAPVLSSLAPIPNRFLSMVSGLQNGFLHITNARPLVEEIFEVGLFPRDMTTLFDASRIVDWWKNQLGHSLHESAYEWQMRMVREIEWLYRIGDQAEEARKRTRRVIHRCICCLLTIQRNTVE